MMKHTIFFVYFLLVVRGGALAQSIFTYAGTGVMGTTGDGGPATAAKLYLPIGLSFDNGGNLIIAQSNLVRKVNNTTLTIVSVAGSDTASSLGGGGDGGPATCALLVEPYDACIDGQNNWYIADYFYNKIRTVQASTGIISVYAGTGANGSSGDGGLATAAKFGAGVSSVCIDTTRKALYISDEWNYKIRKIDMAAGVISTFAGTGFNGYSGDGMAATSAKLSRVMGVRLDRYGNVYFGDWDNGRIRKVDITTGIITTVAGNGTLGFGGDNGPATSAMINKATGLAIDTCGNIYFTDENNNRVRRIDASTGIINTVIGTGVPGFGGDGGPAISAQLNHPTGIAISNKGILYVSDHFNNRVRALFMGDCSAPLYQTTIYGNINATTLFPNPMHDKVQLECKFNGTAGFYDLVGRKVMDNTVQAGNNELDIKRLDPGIYIIKVRYPDGDEYTNRVLKD